LIDFLHKRFNLKRMKKTKSKKTAPPAPTNSKELLLNAAREIFAANGYDRTSTRDIAKAAGVNISLISYHFQGKEGLYRAILEEMTSAPLETVERVLKKPTTVEEFRTRLQIFVEEFVQHHMRSPQNSCIVMREMTNNDHNEVFKDLFKNKFAPIFEKLIEFLSSAQKQKFICQTLNVEITGVLLMGCITHLIRTDGLRKTVFGRPGLLEPGQLEKTVAQITRQFFTGVQPK
jgi:TetR/AcrR family transcriptional regulator